MMQQSPRRPRDDDSAGEPQPPPAKSRRITSLSTIDSTKPLPDEILVSILGRLTLRYAIRSATVSRQWRDAAVSSILQSNKLVFNAETMLGSSSPFSCHSHGQSRRFAEKKKKFVAAVNQFLLFLSNLFLRHNGLRTTISSFQVEYCLSSKFSHDIDGWVDYAITVLGVRKFCLALQCVSAGGKNRKNLLAVQKKHGKFVIRSGKVFDCNMDELRLSACRLEPNLFRLQQEQSTRSLKTLKLSNVQLAKYDVESMFDYLPKVETLHFDHCSLPEILCLDSLQALKALTVYCCTNIEVIQTSNNLKLSSYICRGSGEILCDLSGARNLEVLVDTLDATAVEPFFSSGSRNYPMLHDLSIIISKRTNELAYIPDRLPVWSTITKLELILPHHRPFEVTKIISIITALPSLRELRVKMGFDDLLWTEILETGNCSIRHLEVVKLCTSHITTSLLLFAYHLAKHAISLKRVIFRRVFCSEPWEEDAIEEVSELQKHFMEVSFVLGSFVLRPVSK